MASPSFRKLTKLHPGIGDLTDLVNKLPELSDREIIIMGASYLDSALEFALRHKFQDLSGYDSIDIFESNGPLGTFSGKISIARAVNVISEDVRIDLTKIREVRNVFAHSTLALSFDRKEIADKCSHFFILNNIEEERAKLHHDISNLQSENYDRGPWIQKNGKTIDLSNYLLLADTSSRAVCYVPMPENNIQSPKARLVHAIQIIWYFLMCRGAVVLGKSPNIEKKP